MAKRVKIYLDTSVLNFILETNRDESTITTNFLKQASEESILFVSEVVITEVNKAYDLRRRRLIKLIEKHGLNILTLNDEANNLAKVYLNYNLIPLKHFNDALHIAIATVNRCDFIVSWNYKHIVKARTIRNVHLINHQEGYGLLEIVSPREFTSK